MDLQARLRNLRIAEKCLNGLLAEATGKLAEILEVEREIRRVREEIEVLQGRQRYWDNQVTLATLNVTYQMAETYRPRDTAGPAFSQRLLSAVESSWKAFTRSLAGIAIATVYALPWLVIAVVVVTVVVIRHRRKKGRQPSRTSP